MSGDHMVIHARSVKIVPLYGPLRRIDVMYNALREIGRDDLAEAIIWYDDIGWMWLDDDGEHPDDLAVCAKAAEVAEAAHTAGRCQA